MKLLPRWILVLVAAGSVVAAFLPSAQVMAMSGPRAAVSVSHGTWEDVGPMPSRRAEHVMVRLADGRVLAAGGGMANDARSKRSADIYNPRTERWSAAEPMHRTRSAMSAILLRNGDVLVVGGVSTAMRDGGLMNVVLRSAETYDPVADQWTKVAAMHDRRVGPVIERLPHGRILVAGGHNNRAGASSAEIYHPKTGDWRMTDPMSVPRYLGASTRLRNGDILVAGGPGTPGAHRRTAERYVVNRHEWRPAGQFRGGQSPQVFRLPNGRVLSIAGGGQWGSPTRRVAKYTPSRNAWHRVASLPAARGGMPVVSLGGYPLVLGGRGPGTHYTTATGFLWRPARHGWVRWTWMPQPLWNLAAVRLRDGSILAAGGQSLITEGTHLPTKYAFRFSPD